jgi:hypothetical protein
MLIYDATGGMDAHAHFVVLDWQADRINKTKNFPSPHALELPIGLYLGDGWCCHCDNRRIPALA